MREQRWYEKDLCPSLTRKLDKVSERFENAAGILYYGLILLIVLAALFGLVKFVKWIWYF